MLVNCEFGAKVNEVKLDTPSNAFSPMLVTLAGMIIEVNFDAPWNALEPMLVTLAGMVIEVKLVT